MEALTLFTKKFKRSFKKDTNISLATKLKQCEKEKIDALHELDVLKRKHMNLENDMHSLFETNELLESKVAKLQVELDKANTTFKKLNAGSQILDEVLSSQKVASDRGGLGYKAEGSLKSKARGKMIFFKPNSSAPASPVANKAKSPFKEKNVKYARTKLPKAKKLCPAVKIATTKRGENMNVMSKHVPKIVEKFEKVKTRSIWVRKLDLRTCIDLPSNPLDDYGSSKKVDLTF
ncbi:hypothetical protein RHGRI_001329 [Rhododendron griersonianum]|uniref:Uncharacterized protein n=1 Tax=Rhododendron griersonianum TaxID=479676 RepID=A0AAV6LND6_9ERIC|nr:hypothetical protein RHGRI_001329 [Rhododendron griersonianum]